MYFKSIPSSLGFSRYTKFPTYRCHFGSLTIRMFWAHVFQNDDSEVLSKPLVLSFKTEFQRCSILKLNSIYEELSAIFQKALSLVRIPKAVFLTSLYLMSSLLSKSHSDLKSSCHLSAHSSRRIHSPFRTFFEPVSYSPFCSVKLNIDTTPLNFACLLSK